MILHVGRDLSVYMISNGKKIAEFKEKKEKEEILTLKYDPKTFCLLTSTVQKTLNFFKKLNDNTWDFQ